MGWQPDQTRCPECRFDWTISGNKAIVLVRHSPVDYERAMADVDPHRPVRPSLWTPDQYLWHMVDVLRFGIERLLTLTLDPTAGVPCWDENDLAAFRSYDALSPVVGVRLYGGTVGDWVDAARKSPADARTSHPEFGTIDALDVVRRNAHEVQHHLLDIRSQST